MMQTRAQVSSVAVRLKWYRISKAVDPAEWVRGECLIEDVLIQVSIAVPIRQRHLTYIRQ